MMPSSGIMPIPMNMPMMQMSPQQLQSMMWLRALQGRSYGQVRTGYPQMIPLGQGNMMGPGQMYNSPAYYGNQQQPIAGGDAKQTASQKRAEARRLRDEQKRSERESAKAKAKEKAEQAKAAKAARADAGGTRKSTGKKQSAKD